MDINMHHAQNTKICILETVWDSIYTLLSSYAIALLPFWLKKDKKHFLQKEKENFIQI